VPVQEVATCTGDGILLETLGRVRRIVMEKRQRSPLPPNDIDSRPRLFVLNDPFHTTCGETGTTSLLQVLFIGLVLLLDLTWAKIAPGVEGTK